MTRGAAKKAASSSTEATSGVGKTKVRLRGASHGAQRNAVVEVDAKKAKSLIDRGLASAVE